MQILSLNVKSLSSRLSLLLSWGFDVLVLSEVRVARAAIRSLTRAAKASGYDAVFGVPPPPHQHLLLAQVASP